MNTAVTKEVTIAGAVFALTQPFAEGHVMTAGEAKALNQTRNENLANNLRKAVGEALEKVEADADGLKIIPAETLELVAKYDADYEFTLATVSAKRVTDPIEVEAKKLAKIMLTEGLRKKGIAIAKVAKDKVEEKLAEIAARADVRARAKKIVKERAQLAESGMDDMFSGMEEAPAETAEPAAEPAH